MKNKIYNKIIAILVVLFCTTNFAYAQPSFINSEIKHLAVKLGIAMIAVVLVTILLTIGLSLYNRFLVPDNVKDYKLNKDSLRTPADKEEAVMMYITKNRLK